MPIQERLHYFNPTIARRLQKKSLLGGRGTPICAPEIPHCEYITNSANFGGVYVEPLDTGLEYFSARSARAKRTKEKEYPTVDALAPLGNKIVNEATYGAPSEGRARELALKGLRVPLGNKVNVWGDLSYARRLDWAKELGRKISRPNQEPVPISTTQDELEELGATDVHFYGEHAVHVRAIGALLLQPKFTEVLERSGRTAYHLTIQDIDAIEFGDLLRSRLLARTYSLDFSNTKLIDLHAIQLAGSRQLERLQWLDLSENEISKSGVLALAQATVAPRGNLARLQRVHLLGNPFNPIARFSYDQGDIYEAELPPEGRNLENIVGATIPWLHPHVVNGREIFKNRYSLGPL